MSTKALREVAPSPRRKSPPAWVTTLLDESAAPSIAGILRDSRYLLPAWRLLEEALDRASAARVVGLMPEWIGFTWRANARRLPYSERRSAKDQRRDRAAVLAACKRLQAALRKFEPASDMRLHQLYPGQPDELHFFLVGLRIGAGKDSLLERVASVASKTPVATKTVLQRASRPFAHESFFVRQFAPALQLGKAELSAELRHFLAAVTNALAESERYTSDPRWREWDESRIRQCLRAAGSRRKSPA